MSVSETQPISVGDLDAILPLPISAGGTGATTATDAIVALGIDDYVNQVVQNWQDIQNSKWTGSASLRISDEWRDTTTKYFSITQKTSSDNIAIQSGNIYVAKAGTYRFTGGFVKSGGSYGTTGGAPVNIKLTTGDVILSTRIYLGTNNADILKTVTFNGATSFGITINLTDGYIAPCSMNINNLQINRIS